MNEQLFYMIYYSLSEYDKHNKELYRLGIDLNIHDKHLYNLVINILKELICDEQLDFIIFCIFSDEAKDIGIIDCETAWEKYNEIEWENI